MTTRRLVISRSAALVGAASTGLLLPSIVRAQSGPRSVVNQSARGSRAQYPVSSHSKWRLHLG